MHINYPFIPQPMPYQSLNYEEEILTLKREINKLKERITALEKQNQKNYLQNDDKLHMM